MQLEEFIKEQMHERYKHFIIYGPPMQSKSKLAVDISEKFDGLYIDLIHVFQEDSSKKCNIDIYGPLKLINYIRDLNNYNKKFLVIDQFDFLINTWDDNQFRELLVFIDRDQSDICYMFVMHNYRILEREESISTNDKGHNRLINIYNIMQGGTING